MRIATAADEIHPLKDPRVQSNYAYLVIILLSRVVTRLGSVPQVNPKVIEDLYAASLAYLQKLYNRINLCGKSSVPAACPKCGHEFKVEVDSLGGGMGYPLDRRMMGCIVTAETLMGHDTYCINYLTAYRVGNLA
jgi:hypothetical protein